MLDAHQARTATAEGQHSESPDKGASKPSAPDAGASADAKPADNGDQKQPTTGDAAPLAALVLAAVPLPATAAPQPGAPVEGTPAPATQMVVAGGAPTPVVQVVTPADAAPAAPAVQAEIAATGPVVATPAAPAAAAAPVAVDPAPSTPVAQPATTQPVAAAPAAPAQTATPDGNLQGQPKPGTGTPAPVMPQAPAVADQARPGQQPPGQPQAQPAQVQPPVQQQHAGAAPPVAMTSAAPGTPATPLPAAIPVPLARTAETVEHVLSLASARGITHARIALHPAELGTVDVHIRSTAEGLVARVVAHSAEAVQTLQHAAGDLRRSLEEQGLNVLNLDIGQSGQGGTGRAGSESGGRNTYEGPSTGAETDDATTQTSTLRLPSGVLVDVLA
jgi:flagellar hook-length control protein FliK